MDEKEKKGYLKYVIENCESAFDELCEINKKIQEWRKPTCDTYDEEINHIGTSNRIIQDYLIIRVAGLFDNDRRVISFEREFKGNPEYESIKKEDIIEYIRELRYNFTAHSNEEFIEKGKVPYTPKILSSNLKELLGRLKALVNK